VTAAGSQLPSNNQQYGVAIADYVPDQNEQETGQTMAQYAQLGFTNSLNQFESGGENNVFSNNVAGNLDQLFGGMDYGRLQWAELDTGFSRGHSRAQRGCAQPHDSSKCLQFRPS
jgi:hypothetical protein